MNLFGLGLRGHRGGQLDQRAAFRLVLLQPALDISCQGQRLLRKTLLPIRADPLVAARLQKSRSDRNPNSHSFSRVFLFFLFFFTLYTLHFTLMYAATTNFGKTAKIEIAPARKTLRVGEKFVYGVYWMGLNVGEGVLEVKELVSIDGREAYHIVATAKSNDFLSAFYKVEDIVHSYVDKKKLCSLRFEKYQMEGRYKADEVVIFDQERRKGYYESLLNKTKKEFDIPYRVHDLVSAFYYFRTLDVAPNSKVGLDINADEKNWKVDMGISSPEQLEILRKGVHKVFCVEPRAPFKGVISKRGKAWVYFSVDENRVPVLIKIRIPFGYVVGVLERAE